MVKQILEASVLNAEKINFINTSALGYFELLLAKISFALEGETLVYKFLPFKALNPQKSILMQGVKSFEIKDFKDFFEIEICTQNKCQTKWIQR